jgi:periplasmic protein CpxP/Spy
MKTWIKRSLIGLATLGVLAGGMAACGHRMHHGFGAMNEADAAQWRGRMVDRAAGKLDLDAAQKAKLAGLGEALAQQRRALVGPAGNDPRAEFQALLAGSTLDRAKAQALVDAKTGAVQANAPQVVAAAGDFYDSLKPEQQQKLRDWLASRRHRRG